MKENGIIYCVTKNFYFDSVLIKKKNALFIIVDIHGFIYTKEVILEDCVSTSLIPTYQLSIIVNT